MAAEDTLRTIASITNDALHELERQFGVAAQQTSQFEEYQRYIAGLPRKPLTRWQIFQNRVRRRLRMRLIHPAIDWEAAPRRTATIKVRKPRRFGEHG